MSSAIAASCPRGRVFKDLLQWHRAVDLDAFTCGIQPLENAFPTHRRIGLRLDNELRSPMSRPMRTWKTWTPPSGSS